MEITCVVTKTQIVFPKIMDTIIVNKDIYADLIKNIKKEKVIFLLIIDEAKENNIGTVCKVISNFTSQKGVPTLVVGGMQRAIIEKVVKNKLEREDYFIVDAILFKKIKEETKSLSTQLAKELLMSFDKVLTLATIPKENLEAISNNKTNVGAICDIITNSLDFEMHKKYKILNAVKILDRFKLVLKYIEEYMEVLIISQEIIKDSRDSLDKKNKEFYLRNKIEIIQNKLKEETGELKPGDELVGYEEKIKNKNLPEEAYKEAMNELNRMKRMHSASHEYSVLSTYLDWMIDLPWNESTKDNLDIGKARKKLNEDHYGLESPKKRILEYLAIRKLNPNSRSPILCFVGPSGTGKTSLGKSIAESMGREFQRMSLGGIRDETIIRGFSRTYMGSRPGRIIQVLKRAGTNNPIIMLDEVDKLGSDVKGDPSSALLEALDPEQNDSFNDHYLNVPFDLSKVIFITTANMLEAIPHALQDRMEIIKFSGYSTDEKMKIATNFQIPRQLKEHGLKDLKFTKSAIDEIITGYTRESGVRNLEREIANVIRGIGTDFVEHNKFTKTISKKTINKYLGTPIYKNEDDIIIKNSGIGIGMYYSAVGGGITFYEAVSMHPQGKYGTITTSGSLKKVMEESIIVASKWIRSNRIVIKDITGINCNITHRDTHVHVPEGGTPKDGPSAGSAIIVALVSLYTGVIPKKMTAYTGEITLRGKILPVGGVREKVLGAHRAGIKNIVMPTWCKKDLDKIANDVKRDINFYFVDTIPEMLEIAFPKT